MKMNKFFAVAMAAVALVSFASCDKNDKPGKDDDIVIGGGGEKEEAPDVTNLPAPKEGEYVLAFKFEGEVCNDIVLAGSYMMNEAGDGWETDPSKLLVLNPLEGFKGWYFVVVPFEGEDALQAKPVQLQNDGKFAWDYQTGDENSWVVEEGDVAINAGFAGEADLTYNSNVCILVSKSWKNGNSPCHVAAAGKVVITVKVPACGCPENVEIIGNFDGWAGTAMTKVEAGVFQAEIEGAAGATEYKFREAGTWDNEILVLGEDELGEATWGGMGNIKLAEGSEISHDFSGAEYKWSACEE